MGHLLRRWIKIRSPFRVERLKGSLFQCSHLIGVVLWLVRL
jgi:Cft2 family RNA processing exonuclease